jgi:histidine triad (HIT) family protein
MNHLSQRRSLMQNCVFCRIVAGELPCVKVFEDERVLAFMDINPISDGHTLIIPKAHAENLWEISGPDLCAIHLTAKKIAAALRKTMDLAGVAVLQLNGRGVNQVVMHYHLHLIPRVNGGPELKMTDWKLVAGDMDRIRDTGRKIAAATGA